MEVSESNLAKLKFSSMKNLLDLLVCPICVEIMYPPMYQCTNGHALCTECKAKVTRCPSCQAGTLDIRSLSLEKLAECFEYSCIYHTMGCKETLELASKRQHEEHCEFKPYQCPYLGGCNFKGNIMALVLHLKDVHRCSCYNIPILGTDELNLREPAKVYNYSNSHFFISFETISSGKYKDDLLVNIAFMGEYEEANKFRCKLEIGNDDHKLIWKGVPLSIRQGRKELNDTPVGLIIPECFLSRFLIRSGSSCYFHIKGYIWDKERDSKGYFDF